MKTDYAGIDYGLGRTNVDHETGIRYGVIHHGSVGAAWYDTSDPDYGKARCPECQAEAVDYDEELHGDWPYEKHESCDYACTECKRVFGSESAFPEEPFAFTLDDGEYVAEQSGDDTDIHHQITLLHMVSILFTVCAGSWLFGEIHGRRPRCSGLLFRS